MECPHHEIVKSIDVRFPGTWNCGDACNAWEHEQPEGPIEGVEYRLDNYEDYACNCKACGDCVCGWCV